MKISLSDITHDDGYIRENMYFIYDHHWWHYGDDTIGHMIDGYGFRLKTEEEVDETVT